MLYINNHEYKLLTNEIRYVDSTVNKIKVHTLLVELTFIHNDIKGYISFYVDFFYDRNFKNIENKTYIELPTDLDVKIDMIEIYDTEKFIGFIDSEIHVFFGNVTNNEIEAQININDENIKLKYKGYLKNINKY